MEKKKLKLNDICASIKTIGSTTYCNIFNELYVVDKYQELPIVINKLQNVNILNINIHDINTLCNFDKKLDNLPCLLVKITFRLHLKMFVDNFSFTNFNFIHKLKIPHDCKIEFKLDDTVFTILELVPYEYLTLKNGYDGNDKIMVKYTNNFVYLPKSISYIGTYTGTMHLMNEKTKSQFSDTVNVKNINKINKKIRKCSFTGRGGHR